MYGTSTVLQKKRPLSLRVYETSFYHTHPLHYIHNKPSWNKSAHWPTDYLLQICHVATYPCLIYPYQTTICLSRFLVNTEKNESPLWHFDAWLFPYNKKKMHVAFNNIPIITFPLKKRKALKITVCYLCATYKSEVKINHSSMILYLQLWVKVFFIYCIFAVVIIGLLWLYERFMNQKPIDKPK